MNLPTESQAIIPDKIKGPQDAGMRVIKMSFSRLAWGDHTLIGVVNDLTIQNSQMAVRGSIILNNMVAMCVSEDIDIPADLFSEQTFIYQAFNWHLSDSLQNIGWGVLRDAVSRRFAYRNNDHGIVNPATRFRKPENILEGQGWLIGYLVLMYRANMITSVKATWRAVINDSIKSYQHIHDLGRYSPIIKEIKRRIFNPARTPPDDAPANLPQEALDLIDFHREGFLVADDNALDDDYFETSIKLYHNFVFHFGKCLERQCELEVIHKVELKKRLPLPMFSMGNCVSLQIDFWGLYYILKEFENRHCSANTLHAHPFDQLPTAKSRWKRGHFEFWLSYLFRIHEVVRGSKTFHKEGVILTTDAVQVSVHYMKYVPVNPNAKKKIFKSAIARINASRRSKRKVGITQGKVSRTMTADEISKIGLDMILDEDEAVDMDQDDDIFLQDEDEGE